MPHPGPQVVEDRGSSVLSRIERASGTQVCEHLGRSLHPPPWHPILTAPRGCIKPRLVSSETLSLQERRVGQQKRGSDAWLARLAVPEGE